MGYRGIEWAIGFLEAVKARTKELALTPTEVEEILEEMWRKQCEKDGAASSRPRYWHQW